MTNQSVTMIDMVRDRRRERPRDRVNGRVREAMLMFPPCCRGGTRRELEQTRHNARAFEAWAWWRPPDEEGDRSAPGLCLTRSAEPTPHPPPDPVRQLPAVGAVTHGVWVR